MNISFYMSCVCEVYILLTEQASSLLLPADFSADLGNQPERHIKIIQTSWEQCNKIIQKTLSYPLSRLHFLCLFFWVTKLTLTECI